MGRCPRGLDSAHDLVLAPLAGVAHDPALTAALTAWAAAKPDRQTAWATAYSKALAAVPDGNPTRVPAGRYGPVPVLAGRFLSLAAGGGLEGALTSSTGFYASDETRPLLLLADGAYLTDRARAQHLGGNQWGMMNETGNYPGQAWLWLYTFWYQIRPFSTSPNADALVWAVMALLTVVLLLVPVIPGLCPPNSVSTASSGAPPPPPTRPPAELVPGRATTPCPTSAQFRRGCRSGARPSFPPEQPGERGCIGRSGPDRPSAGRAPTTPPRLHRFPQPVIRPRCHREPRLVRGLPIE